MDCFYSVFKEKEKKKTDIIAARCKDLTLIKDEVEESARSYAQPLQTAVILKCCSAVHTDILWLF